MLVARHCGVKTERSGEFAFGRVDCERWGDSGVVLTVWFSSPSVVAIPYFRAVAGPALGCRLTGPLVCGSRQPVSAARRFWRTTGPHGARRSGPRRSGTWPSGGFRAAPGPAGAGRELAEALLEARWSPPRSTLGQNARALVKLTRRGRRRWCVGKVGTKFRRQGSKSDRPSWVSTCASENQERSPRGRVNVRPPMAPDAQKLAGSRRPTMLVAVSQKTAVQEMLVRAA